MCKSKIQRLAAQGDTLAIPELGRRIKSPKPASVHNKFEVSLGCMRHCLKKEKKKINYIFIMLHQQQRNVDNLKKNHHLQWSLRMNTRTFCDEYNAICLPDVKKHRKWKVIL